MEYYYVPQKIYMIDGEPAKTYGEWPGITSNHWNGSIKVIRADQKEKVFDQNAVAPLLGRRHFSARPGGYQKPYQGKRMFPGKKDLENIEEKKTGLKYIGEPKRPEKPDLNRRHFPPRSGKERIPAPFYIRTFHPDGNTRSDKETPLEKEFGQKKRLTTLEEKRNYLPCRHPGDKHYTLSEHISNFFKEGGLIPGSTNRINYNQTKSIQNNNYYENIDFSIKTLNKDKLWKNKVKNDALKNDENYVKTLGIWEKNILQEFAPDFNSKEKKVEDQNKDMKQQPAGKKAAPPKGKKK